MSKSFWSEFNFSQSPYNTQPLGVTHTDNLLFFGRARETSQFQTQISDENGCVIVLSGEPGVGKTSFFNYQQYILLPQNSNGKRIIPDLVRTPLQKDETPDKIAYRFTKNVVSTLKKYCNGSTTAGSQPKITALPKDLVILDEWLTHEPVKSGESIGATFLNVGGTYTESFQIRDAKTESVETFRDVLEDKIPRICADLNVDGIFGCFENVDEDFADSELASILMSLRDTILSIPQFYFIIIGQSGLYRKLNSLNRKLTQRIKGNGIEIPRLTGGDLHDLIELRIREYGGNNSQPATSPLSSDIHNLIFENAGGIPREALKISGTLVNQIVDFWSFELQEALKKGGVETEARNAINLCAEAVRCNVIENRIPNSEALEQLIIYCMNNVSLISMDVEKGFLDKWNNACQTIQSHKTCDLSKIEECAIELQVKLATNKFPIEETEDQFNKEMINLLLAAIDMLEKEGN